MSGTLRNLGFRGILARAALCFMLLALVESRAHADTNQRILVVPFENVSREGRIFWLGEASAVLLADDLKALGAAAIAREERRQAFETLQVPPAASLTDATVIRIAQILGASEVVVGTLQLEDNALVVRVRSIAIETGRIAKNVTARGPVGELFQTYERLARDLVPSTQVSDSNVRVANPPVAAFENYIKGLIAEKPDTAINYLQTALKIDSTFDRVRLALWEKFEDRGEYGRALSTVQAVPDRSAWAARARFLAGLSELELKKYDDSFATFKGLADSQPAANVFNNLGVIQLRRGVATTSSAPQPAYYFKKAADAEPTQVDYFFNLGYAYWFAKDTQAAVYWLREAVRRNPADGDAHFVLGAALAAAGNVPEANREKELARRLSSVYQDWERRPGPDPVPKGLERVKSGTELSLTHGLEEALAMSGQRDQRELARYYLDRGRRAYREEHDREALADLNRTLFLSPYEAEAHLLIGRVHLRAGQVREAIDAFKISLWSVESADAHVALADAYLEAKDRASAEAEAGRALALDPSSQSAKQMLEKVKARQ
jgi:tetratricopeptide (TPR) repeat protein